MKITTPKIITVSSILFIAAIVFGMPLSASIIDSGWIDGSHFTGSVSNECGYLVGSVWGQRGDKVMVTPNVPSGDYFIDIRAYYGFYRDDPQAPQPNETMMVRTSIDAKSVTDLNGTGGMREDKYSCASELLLQDVLCSCITELRLKIDAIHNVQCCIPFAVLN